MKVEELLSKLIQIQSVNPPGGETAVATYLKDLFDSHQIPNEIIEPSPGRGSFIAYLGEGEKSLLYLSHIDVVPVSEGWDFHPFCGEVKDGFVYGRGALDCKGLVAAEARAVLQLAKAGKLKGRLIFAATADEEAGGKLGVKFLVEKHRNKLKADFAINEGGYPPIQIDGRVYHFTQIGEKGVCWLKLKTKGISSHGAMPMLGDNAVTKMVTTLSGLSRYSPKIHLMPEMRPLINLVAESLVYKKNVVGEEIDRIIKTLNDRTFAAYLDGVTRMTVSPNTIRGGIKTNIVPDSCEAEVDVRILPGQTEEYVLKELKPVLGEATMEVTQYHAPTFSPSQSEYYKLIMTTMKEIIGDAVFLPSISTGASDSRFLREVGVPCYGIAMMTLQLEEKMKRSIHGKDEKIDIGSLKLKSEFLVRLAERYLGESDTIT